MRKAASLRKDSTFQVLITAYRCRCGHEWMNKGLGNVERPRVCPKCKSANWDREYQYQKKERSVAA